MQGFRRPLSQATRLGIQPLLRCARLQAYTRYIYARFDIDVRGTAMRGPTEQYPTNWDRVTVCHPRTALVHASNKKAQSGPRLMAFACGIF